MEWPRPYLVKAKDNQATSAAAQGAAEFVVPVKEWEGLQVRVSQLARRRFSRGKEMFLRGCRGL